MSKPLQPGDTVGILGGGQLARMLCMSAARYGLKTLVFDPARDAPAAQVCNQYACAHYTDADALGSFAAACNVVTYEFENIPLQSLEILQSDVPLRPGVKSLQISQDRLTEKQFLEGLGLPVAPYAAIDCCDDIASAHQQMGSDTILKTRRLGYDGKGQARLKGETDPQTGWLTAWQTIGDQPAVLEARIPFVAEISAIVARGTDGQTCAYDVPVNNHKNGILDSSAVGQFASFAVHEDLQAHAQHAAANVAEALDHVGVLAVEFFVDGDGKLLVNEFAPRVHNSGHWTMDACLVDQFDNHIRAIAGWQLGSTQRHSDALMTNLIGDDVQPYVTMGPGGESQLHLYGKSDVRPGRKMGHINTIAPRKS